jgi:WD40 repeat protein
VVDVYVVRGRKQAYTHAHRCVGHSASVRHLDWSADSQTIATDGADYELLYWDALTGKQQSHNQQNTAWASWTRVLGFPVMGVWVPGSDGTDVNAVDRSADGRYLVTADDYGTVKLLAYPAVVEGSGHR